MNYNRHPLWMQHYAAISLLLNLKAERFIPRLHQNSYSNKFETYAACEAFIKQVDIGKYGYVPSLGFELGCGKYNINWHWLIPAWGKFHKLVLETWYRPYKKDIAEAEKVQFDTWQHNFHSGVDADCVQCSFEIMVGALTWFNFLNKKQAGNETTE